MTDPEAVLSEVRIETARTIVRVAKPTDVPAIVSYFADNRERLRPFEPERSQIFYEDRFWRMQVRQNEHDFAADRALRLFLFPREEPARVIGNIGLSNFVRGAGQYCTLGYSLDADYEGQGMMYEALHATLLFAFRTLNFHRVEANYMPDNHRSGNLLRRLGFTVEGYSRDYLQIDGRWEDHVRTAIIHPGWTAS